jgi:hypothetical protein
MSSRFRRNSAARALASASDFGPAEPLGGFGEFEGRILLRLEVGKPALGAGLDGGELEAKARRTTATARMVGVL